MHQKLPSLTLNDWKGTRDTLQRYAQLAGALREKASNPHPHWWHISLAVSDRGLTTAPMLKDRNTRGQNFELLLDLNNHHLVIESNFRETKRIKLTGQSLYALCKETDSLLNDIGINIPIDEDQFSDGKSGEYDKQAVSNYWIAIQEINKTMNSFRSTLNGERSPVQLWPHHFDLSMSWFSGRLVRDKDPNDFESSKEQMMFGFSSGDDGIPDAYFYITAYPIPEGFPNFDLPVGARWNTNGFQGGVMMYNEFASSNNPEEKLLNYFETFQNAGAIIMK